MRHLPIACLASILTACIATSDNPFLSEYDRAYMLASEKFDKECPMTQYYVSRREPIPEDHPGGPWTPDRVEKCIELYKPIMARIDPEKYARLEKNDKWRRFLNSDRWAACHTYYTTKDAGERDGIIQQWSIKDHNECLEYIAYMKLEIGLDDY